MERRKTGVLKPTALPADFLKMVTEIFTSNFDEALKEIKKRKGRKSKFEAHGNVYNEEIVLAVSLVDPEELAATTVYASLDFDPAASSPTIQDLLNAAVDAIGSIFGTLTQKSKLDALLDQSLSALQNVPFQWTAMDVEKFRVWLKIDKANPKLDQLADEWLAKNDPELRDLDEESEREAEELFVTGPKKGSGRGTGGAGTIH